jgi:hypothetical protein
MRRFRAAPTIVNLTVCGVAVGSRAAQTPRTVAFHLN